MRAVFLARLVLDALAAALLFASLAYDWLGNMVHEVIGTGLFMLLIGHNLFNRRWYRSLAKASRDGRMLAVRAINLVFLGIMLALLITSVIISQAVFSFLPLSSPFWVRQIHASLGYMALLMVGMHLGLQWTVIMSVARAQMGITSASRVRIFLLRTVAAAIALYGAYSLTAINLSTKLLMQMSFEFWDFENETLAFFGHAMAIVGLFTALSHYSLLALTRLYSARPRSARIRPAASGDG